MSSKLARSSVRSCFPFNLENSILRLGSFNSYKNESFIILGCSSIILHKSFKLFPNSEF